MYDAFRRSSAQLRHLVMGINILSLVIGSRRLFASGAPIRQVTYVVDMSDPDTVTHLSAIVDSLENLDVLDQSHASCYTVDRIVKSESRLDPGTWKISVDLYVQEVDNDVSDAGDVDKADSKSPTKACPNVNISGSVPAAVDSIVSLDMESGNTRGNHSNSASNGTVVHFIMDNVTTIPVSRTKDKEGRLSRTQIMVISTCSTVIGLFFLVALAMRIRNYLKRYRAEQQNRRTAFRSNSSGLRGSDSDDHSPQTVNPPIMHFPRFKPHRSHGYKFGQPVGFSYFYAHGASTAWTPSFPY